MNTNFKHTFTPKLFIAFKMAYSCCFGQKGNINVPDFLQKFYNIIIGEKKSLKGPQIQPKNITKTYYVRASSVMAKMFYKNCSWASTR